MSAAPPKKRVCRDLNVKQKVDLIKDARVHQIGFMKGKRTSDHIFVLKCIIEEANKRKTPIYTCFVDLKRAFDTVWRIRLWYKLGYDYKISSKFVNMCSMYHNLSGRFRTSTDISDTFNISIGLRQGCNLSPYLFNL